MEIIKKISEEEMLARIQWPTKICECEDPLVDGIISMTCVCGGALPDWKVKELEEAVFKGRLSL